MRKKWSESSPSQGTPASDSIVENTSYVAASASVRAPDRIAPGHRTIAGILIPPSQTWPLNPRSGALLPWPSVWSAMWFACRKIIKGNPKNTLIRTWSRAPKKTIKLARKHRSAHDEKKRNDEHGRKKYIYIY